MSSAHSGLIECHLSLSIKSPDKWRQEIGVFCDGDAGPRRAHRGDGRAVPGLKRTMARRQPSSVLSICMSRILDTSSVSTLQGKRVPVRHVLTRAPPRRVHWIHEAQGRPGIAGCTGPGHVHRKEASP